MAQPEIVVHVRQEMAPRLVRFAPRLTALDEAWCPGSNPKAEANFFLQQLDEARWTELVTYALSSAAKLEPVDPELLGQRKGRLGSSLSPHPLLVELVLRLALEDVAILQAMEAARERCQSFCDRSNEERRQRDYVPAVLAV